MGLKDWIQNVGNVAAMVLPGIGDIVEVSCELLATGVAIVQNPREWKEELAEGTARAGLACIPVPGAQVAKGGVSAARQMAKQAGKQELENLAKQEIKQGMQEAIEQGEKAVIGVFGGVSKKATNQMIDQTAKNIATKTGGAITENLAKDILLKKIALRRSLWNGGLDLVKEGVSYSIDKFVRKIDNQHVILDDDFMGLCAQEFKKMPNATDINQLNAEQKKELISKVYEQVRKRDLHVVTIENGKTEIVDENFLIKKYAKDSINLQAFNAELRSYCRTNLGEDFKVKDYDQMSNHDKARAIEKFHNFLKENNIQVADPSGKTLDVPIIKALHNVSVNDFSDYKGRMTFVCISPKTRKELGMDKLTQTKAPEKVAMPVTDFVTGAQEFCKQSFGRDLASLNPADREVAIRYYHKQLNAQDIVVKGANKQTLKSTDLQQLFKGKNAASDIEIQIPQIGKEYINSQKLTQGEIYGMA